MNRVGPILHHNDGKRHTLRSTVQMLHGMGSKIFRHPPYICLTYYLLFKHFGIERYIIA